MSNENTPQDECHRPAVGGPVERMVRPGAEAHWYCLASNGIATLCVDMADAVNTAKMCDEQYPKYAPHRAVMLGDVAAERERCAKLCEEVHADTSECPELALHCAARIRGA